MPGPFRVMLNDSSVPIYRDTDMIEPPNKFPSIRVSGYTGVPGPVGSEVAQAGQVRWLLAHTAGVVNKYLSVPLVKWSSTNELMVFPRAGKQLNAFYNRSSLRFFFENHPITKKIVYTCESNDIVSHEFGHAVLDGLRPDLWNSPAIEVAAFHESFGDCLSLLSTLNHPEIIGFLIGQTGGNIRLSNSVSRIAESMGECLAKMYPQSGRCSDYLRNAVNDFIYVDPSKLPNSAPDAQISRGSHSFSRIMTGAFYDIIAGLYEMNVANGIAQFASLVKAVDEFGKLWFRGVETAPLSPRFYSSIARSVCAAAKADRFAGLPIINKVFVNRKIVEPFIPMMADVEMIDLGDLNTEITKEEFMPKEMQTPTLVKLADYVNGSNPLYAIEVELPTNNQTGITACVDNDAVQAARDGVDHLVATDQVCYNEVGSKEKEFQIDHGKLVRCHFSCW